MTPPLPVELAEKNFDKKLLVGMYLVVLAAMLGYLAAFASPSDMVIGFFIGQIGTLGGALGNIITGRPEQRAADLAKTPQRTETTVTGKIDSVASTTQVDTEAIAPAKEKP